MHAVVLTLREEFVSTPSVSTSPHCPSASCPHSRDRKHLKAIADFRTARWRLSYGCRGVASLIPWTFLACQLLPHPLPIYSDSNAFVPLSAQASYKLWPAAHLVNFALVPPAYRVLYTNLVSVRHLPHRLFVHAHTTYSSPFTVAC